MIFLTVIGIIFVGDFIIKNYIEKKKKEDSDTPILGGRLIIRRLHNKGACLSIGSKKSVLVAAVSLAFAIMMSIIFVATLTTKGNNFLKAGLSLLLGGAYSNTYDRLKRKFVVDYISFASKSTFFQGIVFNISDFCIAIGAAMAAIATILNPNI